MTTTIRKETYMPLREIKKDLMKAIKWEEDVRIMVKIYDCSENDEQTFDVEINYAVDGEAYTNGYVNDTFYGEIDDDDVNAKVLMEAMKRGQSVLRTVKGWFENNDDVEVERGVEVYHV
jgi:hypothetical protein